MPDLVKGEPLRQACRERIVANFGVGRMVDKTEALLAGLCAGGRA